MMSHAQCKACFQFVPKTLQGAGIANVVWPCVPDIYRHTLQ